MAKKFHFGNTGRLRMMAGVNLLADAVQITLGPHGRNVLIQHRTEGIAPIFTRDGVTVARSIDADDKAQNVGVEMLRQVAAKVSQLAGDGTSTAIVLARRIAGEAVKAMSAGMDPKMLREGIEMAVQTVIADLKVRARKCTDTRALAALGSIASNGDEGIGNMLAEAFERVGANGVIALELGDGFDDKMEFVEGAEWDQGYPSRYFVTDKDRETAELEHPYVLLYDRAITSIDDLIPVLDMVREENGSLLVIAEDVEERALPALLLNHIRGIIKSVPIKPPGYGETRLHSLGDLAVLLGGRAIMEACGDDLARVTLADLGRAKRVVVTENKVTLIGGGGDPQAIRDRIAMVQQQIDAIRNGDPRKGSVVGKAHDIEQLEDRLRRLSGLAAVIRVGGGTDVEIKERVQRFHNAMNSIRGALTEGVLPGGGTGLLRAAKALDALPREPLDLRCGIDIVGRAITAPLRLISSNAGEEPGSVITRIQANDNDFFGLDARRGVFGDLHELGVLDPVMVTRTALQEAAGVATVLMTSECLITEIPPADPLYGFTPEWAEATREDPRS